MTVNEYLLTTTSNTPFLGVATVPAVCVTREFQEMLRDFIQSEYGDYEFRRMISSVDNPEVLIKSMCDTVYRTHEYTYKKLYASTEFDYNPIENYRMHEEGSEKNSGTDTTRTKADQYTDTDTIGDTQVTDTWGERKTVGDSVDTVAPFESQTYKNYSKNDVASTEQSAIDTHLTTARTDIHDLGERNIKQDVEHGHNVNHELDRSGNIGVTTTQEMGEQERRFVRFNFVRIVANDLIHTLCITYKGVNF